MQQNRAYIIFILAIALQACKADKQKVYTSTCAHGIRFQKVKFTNLVDSIRYYDKCFVEVTGRYVEGKKISALKNDSTFTNYANNHLFWVNFTQECPLYLTGKHIGLFETEDGGYNKLNNRMVTLRGRIEVKKKEHKSNYSATINEVSYLAIQ